MPASTDEITVQAADAPVAVTRATPPRDLYIDRLRSIMTAFVILHHTAITYGAIGGWFWYEIKPSHALSSQILILFCTINQAYFMGFFFLLAAYFTPGSLQRKGYTRFIGDRFLRLGVPLLAFIVILGPLTAAMAHAADTGRFWETFPYIATHVILIPGPLWFAEALLIFSLAYCAWRAAFGAPLAAQRVPRPIPRGRAWILSALLTGLAALAIRQFIPVGVNIAALQLGYFATYIVLFAVGIAAWRFDWLRQLHWKNARLGIITAFVVLPLMAIGVAVSRTLDGDKGNFGGGMSWQSMLYALWEPFVAWGLIAAWLLIMRRYGNQPSAVWSWLNRRAYAVYIIHPPVLVGISVLLHPWIAPALLKFATTGSLACIATWLLADPLVRVPGIRRVV